MPARKSGKRQAKGGKVTWAQATRDVTITAINRGQLLPLGVIVIVVALIWKMPPENVVDLTRDLLRKLDPLEGIAYILVVVLAVGWFWHAHWMRKRFSDESRRMGLEKSELQRLAAGEDFKSSDEV